MSDDSEYDAYNDFAALTEEDFALVDAASAQALAPSGSQQTPIYAVGAAMPEISIEVEGSHSTEEERGREILSPTSPFRRYRRYGTLSVTDLISLAWRAQLFGAKFSSTTDYGKKEKGKEIIVQQDVAARNDKITKRGRFIHKELELELKPEEIEIVITSKEERWAFRLMSLLLSLVSLAAERCAREIPVFGMVEGIVVLGIVDELRIVDQPGLETGAKRTSDAPLPPPKRAYIHSPSCEAVPVPAPSAPSSPLYSIRLIDTKTRRTDSLPSDEDAEPTRLQVMLYYRLITSLLDRSTQYNFSALWAALGVHATQPFSLQYMRQTRGILGSGAVPGCLQEMALLLSERLAELDLPPVDRTLQVIYRSQNKYPSLGRSLTNKSKGCEERIPSTAREEDADVARAIQLSLAESYQAELVEALKTSAVESGILPDSSNLDHGLPGSVQGLPGPSNQDPDPNVKNQFTSPSKGSPVLNLDLESPLPLPAPVPTRPEILGTKEFLMDDVHLDSYLDEAMNWWKGKRPASGVAERQAGRCFSCEYYNDCEWRAEKAAEKLAREAMPAISTEIEVSQTGEEEVMENEFDYFASFTREEYARIDAAAAAALAETGSVGRGAMPEIPIEVEGSHTGKAEGRFYTLKLSPFLHYRPWGRLSVADLTSRLSWCEVKLEYDLQRRTSRKSNDRPTSVATEKTIVVQQNDNAARHYNVSQCDRVSQRCGASQYDRASHWPRDRASQREQIIQELEPEEKNDFVITCEEERLAFHLMNLISSLKSLGAEECAREIPVFGMVEGVVVTGYIDELRIIDQSASGTGMKRTSDAPLPSPKRICIGSPTSHEAKPIPVMQTMGLTMRFIQIITTYSTDSIPPDENLQHIRLQLMLYCRLLTSLLDPIDFSVLLANLRVDPTRPFSRRFVLQLWEKMGRDPVHHANHLQDMALLFTTRVAALDLPPVSTSLKIIFRCPDKHLTPRRNKGKGRQHHLGRPIGIKEFTMDNAYLHSYLNEAMQWWKGERKARGVAEQHVGRCFSCQYKDDCEWREQKATEIWTQATHKRKAAEATNAVW
ncbi:exonuclease V [Mycena pura]|uniref:Exonuclease V n=1 Tax=Mycena pura TaxID=153505 RepID=A0AAD6UTQ5_9AGAR|nr:exonuclease V [Mycena pura]